MKRKTFYFCVAALTFLLGITFGLIFTHKSAPVVEIVIPNLPEPVVSTNPTKTAHPQQSSSSKTPSPVPVEKSNQSQFEAQNEKFRIVPEEFKQIDFKNLTYPYKFSYNGRKINFVLKDGKYKYDFNDGRGFFNFSDTFYIDLTNDGSPEAIVILWHISCGVSCDGGAPLFYIYRLRQSKLKSLWQFETGSLGYGCGLKSFTVQGGKITMELFGRCSDKMEDSLSMGKFQVKDTTRVTFGFNGKKFVEEKKEFISTDVKSVLNYQSEISINE